MPFVNAEDDHPYSERKVGSTDVDVEEEQEEAAWQRKKDKTLSAMLL